MRYVVTFVFAKAQDVITLLEIEKYKILSFKIFAKLNMPPFTKHYFFYSISSFISTEFYY